MSERSDTNEMWRAVKKERKAAKDEAQPKREAKLVLLLSERPDVELVQELGPHGVRLRRADWPEGRYGGLLGSHPHDSRFWEPARQARLETTPDSPWS